MNDRREPDPPSPDEPTRPAPPPPAEAAPDRTALTEGAAAGGAPGQAKPEPEPADRVPVEADGSINAQRRLMVVVAMGVMFFVLYVAQSIFIPLAASLLITLLFRPLVRRLELWRIPPAVTAVLIVAGLFVVAIGGIATLSGPVSRWVDDALQHLAELEYRLRPLRRPVQEVTEATERIEEATAVDGEQTQVVAVQPTTLAGTVLNTTTSVILGLVLTLVLTFFLLASGDLFLRKVVRLLPTFPTKRDAVETARQLEADVSGYLVTVTLINLTLGAVLWVGFTLAGLPNAILWALLGAAFNYVPYIGPIAAFVLISAASLLSFDTLGQAAIAPTIFALASALEGYLVTPTIMGRRMRLNPVVILLSLMLWGWMWGIVGALLAVPLLVCFKIFCEHVPALQGVGEVLSED